MIRRVHCTEYDRQGKVKLHRVGNAVNYTTEVCRSLLPKVEFCHVRDLQQHKAILALKKGQTKQKSVRTVNRST